MSQRSISEVERVVTAASDLAIKGREQRWTHLSLCVLEAVLSLGAPTPPLPAHATTLCRALARATDRGDPILA